MSESSAREGRASHNIRAVVQELSRCVYVATLLADSHLSVVFAGHWNSTVEGLAQNVLKLYMDYDMVLFDKYVHCYRFGCESYSKFPRLLRRCSTEVLQSEEKIAQGKADSKRRWLQIQKSAENAS